MITNAHIFKQKDASELLTEISIFLKPDRVTGNHKTDLAQGYKGKILAYDIPLDLALVKIVGASTPLPTLVFADSELVDIGEQVYAIGHPEQGGLWSLTTGVISAYWSNYDGVDGKDMFQTDASINRGNSGGPLLDADGEMIGINSMIARKAADGLTITDVNFSIRSSVAINWLNKQGYRFAAVKKAPVSSPEPVDTAPAITEKKAEIAPEAPKVTQEETTEPPAKPAEEQKQAETVAEDTLDKADEPADMMQEEPKELSPGKDQAQDDVIARKPKTGNILTEKKPFRMDDLLEGMREMEDLMDEMKEMMDDYKKRRKK